jgi:outer membrane protein TolC
VDYRQIEPYQPDAFKYTPLDKMAQKLTQSIASQHPPAPVNLKANPILSEETSSAAAALGEPGNDVEAEAADLLAQQFISEAQEKGQRPLLSTKPEELDFFVAMALKNNQPTKVALEEIALAQLKVVEAERGIYPGLKISAYYTEGETEDLLKYAERETKFQVEQPIDYSFKLRHTLAQAKTNFEITKKNYGRLKVDVLHKAETAYYNFIAAKAHLRQKQAIRQEAQEMLERIKKLSRAGMIIPLELDSSRSWFNQLQLQVESISQELRMAELTLKQVLNVKELPAAEAELMGAQKINQDLDGCLQAAFKHRPEIYLSELLVKFNEYGKKIEKDKAGFEMGLVGSYGLYSGHYLTEPWKDSQNWYAGFKVTKPLGASTVNSSYTAERIEPRYAQTAATRSSTLSADFALLDNMKSLSDRKKANIDLRRSLGDFEETLKTINFEVQDAYLKYEKAFMQLTTAEGEMHFRRTEVDITKTRALVGEGGLSSAIESLYQLSEAQTRYAQSLANYYISLANLKKACGYGLEF